MICILSWRGLLESPICSQSVRWPGNLHLPLVSEVQKFLDLILTYVCGGFPPLTCNSWTLAAHLRTQFNSDTLYLEIISDSTGKGFSFWVRKIPQRRAWQPTPGFLPGEFHEQKCLLGYSTWGHKQSDILRNLTWNSCTYTEWNNK